MTRHPGGRPPAGRTVAFRLIYEAELRDRRRSAPRRGLLKATAAYVGLPYQTAKNAAAGIDKARRFDPNKDQRQRRAWRTTCLRCGGRAKKETGKPYRCLACGIAWVLVKLPSGFYDRAKVVLTDEDDNW